MNDLAAGRYVAHSAGSQPAGQVNPGALRKLAAEGHDVAGMASKSWQRFGNVDAPDFDIVITVCDNAAGESCPIWNGNPVTVHWGIPDPAHVEGREASDAAFDLAYTRLRRRIEQLLALPPDLADDELREALQRVHEQSSAAEMAGD